MALAPHATDDMPSPMRLALRQHSRRTPGSADNNAPSISQRQRTLDRQPSPSATPAAASGSMEYLVNDSSPFAAKGSKRQTFGKAKEEVQVIAEYAQTLEPSSRAVHIAAPAPASSYLPPAPQLPAPRRSASAPQLPVPRRSALKVEAPSTPATTFDRHNRISHDGRDLDALLSEVEEQSDGTYCQQASRCAIGPSLAWDLYIRKLQKHLLPPLPASHLSGVDSSLAQRWPRHRRYITCKRRSDIRLSCNGSQSRSS